jgi:hypothetical protein
MKLARGLTAIAFMALCSCASMEPAAVPVVRAPPPPPVHGLLNWVPSNAVSVLYVNYAQLKGDWKPVLDASEPPKARRAEQGFVESEDVDHSVICALGEGPSPENLALYDGRFSDRALQKSRIASRGDLPNYRDLPMWGNGDRSIGKLTKNRVGVGTRAAVQSTIDIMAGAGEAMTREGWYLEANESMFREWPAARRVGLDLTAKSTGPMRERMASMFPEAAALKWFSARAGGTEDFDLVAIGKAETPEAAQTLVYAMAQKAEQWAGRPQVRFMGLSGVLEAIRFENQGTFAKAKLHIKAEEWRGLKQRFSELLAFLRKRQAQSEEKPKRR